MLLTAFDKAAHTAKNPPSDGGSVALANLSPQIFSDTENQATKERKAEDISSPEEKNSQLFITYQVTG